MMTLREIIEDIASRHDERMRSDPRYAFAFHQMQAATKTVEPSRHYDRDGYCDSPARGY
jgi:hypothetical protein